jgi:hypothetical protein
MGNKKSKVQAITDKNYKSKKQKNNIAREILQNNVKGIPTDRQITAALALQQSQKTGPLVKLDLIAILIRLNPTRNNALLSQYKVQDLRDLIRHELYVVPLTESIEENNVQIEEV